MQRFEQNENPPPSKVGGNQENSDGMSTDATHFEVTTPDVVSSNEASDSVSEAKDKEFEAQWKKVEELVGRLFGKEIDELEEEYFADLRSRVDESVAQLEPLFEDMAFYKAQFKELERQKNGQNCLSDGRIFARLKINFYVLYVF